MNYAGYLEDDDCYKFTLASSDIGQLIYAHLNSPPGANFKMQLYTPTGQERGEPTDTIIHYLDPSDPEGEGNWSIRIYPISGFGQYDFDVQLLMQLKVETRQTNNAEIENVTVWIDDNPNYYLSPVTFNVTAGDHTVEVESIFIRTEFPDFYLYTFVEWEDGSTDNPRTVPVSENSTIIAYYKKEYAGGIFKPTP